MEQIDRKKIEIAKTRKGFIAALDQSGGSSSKTLENYGISKDKYKTEEEMFELIHSMRKRVFTSKEFTSDKILGSILFYKTMESTVNGKKTADYLWEDKNIISFLKVDKGLEEEQDNVKLMKEIPDLEEQLQEAKKNNIFGTKMRSVIYKANEEGIKKVVKQQFAYAKIICNHKLVPIIEPEVDINIPDKKEAEEILKKVIIEELNKWDDNDFIMFKFTIPTEKNLYLDLYNYKCVVRIVALSGGYETDKACQLLKENDKMIASFSRALLQNLRVAQTDEEFDNTLKEVIDKIYKASI